MLRPDLVIVGSAGVRGTFERSSGDAVGEREMACVCM